MRMSELKKERLVPEHRFPEFKDAGAWDEKTLGDITYKTDKKNKEGKKYPLYSINNKVGFVPQAEQFDGVDSNKRGYDITLYKVIEKNTFAYNPARINVGSIGFSGELNNIIVSSLYVCFKSTKNVEDKFLQHFLETTAFNKSVNSNVEGGIRSYLFYESFSRINILLPKKEEQQKIADCLTSVDELITAQTQKLDALKTHKKGLMQQLFPSEGETVPKLRFPEFWGNAEWEDAKLGEREITTFVKERIPLDRLTLKTYVSTENLLPDYAGVTTASKLPSTGSFTQYIKGDILVSNIRPYLKKVWAATNEGGTSNDVIVIRAKSKIRSSFLAYLLRNDEFISYVMKGAKGVKMPRGDIYLMKEYPVAIPTSPKEQQKIADCLTSVDDLITVQTQKLDALKSHKNGLMQRLFPTIDDDCMDTKAEMGDA
jgi:type I restriction enzyme S subunit